MPGWAITEDPSQSSWNVAFRDPKFIEGLYGDRNFSVTDMRSWPRATYFNIQNWFHVPKSLVGAYTLKEYRTYLINHEFGHALGSLGHPTRELTGPAHIMYQHTRGLQPGQRKNLWPLHQELQKFKSNLKRYMNV